MTKKQAKIPHRVSPRDVHGILQGLWDDKPFFPGWPNVKLPPKVVFDEIIDVCYHASMLTEEGRPTVFRIVFLDRQSPVSPRDDDELPPVTRYLLKEPVPFTQGELRRVAPVADPRRVLIAVEQSGGRLQIYGLVDIGLTLWEMARRERICGYSSPEALIVMSTRPGELSISRGDIQQCFGLGWAASAVFRGGWSRVTRARGVSGDDEPIAAPDRGNHS